MVSIKEKISILVKNEIFNAVPRDKLSEIVNALTTQDLPENKVLFRQGDPGDCLYFVYSGKLRVFLQGEDGIETNLNWLGPGDSFGEMALLTDEPRSINIEAVEQTRLLILTKKDFENNLTKYPGIYKNCIKQYSRLLKRDEKRIITDIEQEHKSAKVSHYDFVFIIAVVLLFATIFNWSNPNGINILPKFYDPAEFPKIDIVEAKDKFDLGKTIFVDARPTNFFDKSHIKGAVNLPFPSFEINYMYMSNENKKKEIIVYGRSIGAIYDEEVARQLSLFGHENVKILQGSKQLLPLRWLALDTWKENRYPAEGYGHE